MNVIEKYRSLPEAKRMPDAVWTVQHTLDALAALDAKRAEISEELERQNLAMFAVLMQDWTKAELQKAGFNP